MRFSDTFFVPLGPRTRAERISSRRYVLQPECGHALLHLDRGEGARTSRLQATAGDDKQCGQGDEEHRDAGQAGQPAEGAPRERVLTVGVHRFSLPWVRHHPRLFPSATRPTPSQILLLGAPLALRLRLTTDLPLSGGSYLRSVNYIDPPRAQLEGASLPSSNGRPQPRRGRLSWRRPTRLRRTPSPARIRRQRRRQARFPPSGATLPAGDVAQPDQRVAGHHPQQPQIERRLPLGLRQSQGRPWGVDRALDGK